MSVAGQHLASHELLEAFRIYPEFAVMAASASLASGNLDAGRIARLAIEAAPSLALSNAALREALGTSPNSRLAGELLERLLPELLPQIAIRSGEPRPDLSEWLVMPKVQQALARSSIAQVEAMFHWRFPPDALDSVLSTLLDLREPEAFDDIAWSTTLVCTFLRRTSARPLHLTSDRLVRIVNLPVRGHEGNASVTSEIVVGDVHVFLMGEILGAVRQTHCLRCESVVAAVFYPVYSRLQQDRPGPLRACAWWAGMWWSHAKKWRHWLLEAAVGGDWNSRTLHAAAGNDKDLLEHLGSLAMKHQQSREYWKRKMVRPRLQAD